MGFLSKIFKHVTKGLRTIVGWLIPTPDQPPAKAVMVEKQGSDNSIPVVYGTRRIGGIKVHKYVTDASGGAQNEYLHLIVPLCEGPIDSIAEVFFDGVSENDAKWNKSGGGKWFTVQRFLGEPDQLASASAVSQIPNWTVNHRLRGIAYLYIRIQMDAEQSIWRGEPAITATVVGRKILDPRSGLTEYSDNPPLQLLDYLTNTVYGKGLPLSRLNQASFLQAADLADEQLISDVTINEITTELYHRRFTSNAVIDTGSSVFNNVKKLLSGMRGLLPIGSGFIRLAIETSGEPVFHFSHGSSEATNHATITGPVKAKSGRKSDRYNRVIVRFPNKNTSFENDEIFYPADENPLAQQWLDEDNGIRLEQSFEFETITSKAEAYQMAEIIAKRSRNRLECSFPASPAAIQVEPGDIVSVTDDTRGWDAKPFRVEQVKLEDDGDCDIELIEHQNAIYPWSGTSYSERVGGTNLGDPANIPAPTGLSVAPDPTFATAGRLTWNSENNAFIRRFDVRILSGSTLVYSQEVLAPVFAVPLLAAGTYTIQVYAVSTIGTRSAPAAITYALTSPVAPQSITVIASNFELDCRPQLTGAGLGTQFEFAIVTTDVVRGRGANIVFAGLVPGTEYTVFARTVNALGISAWASVIATTLADGSVIADLIGEDIAATIFDDVVAEVNANLQQTVDQALGDIPTETEVQQLIDDSIALVNAADTEDPRVEVLQNILGVANEFEQRVQIRQVSFAIAQEGQLRAAAILELTAADQAIIYQIQQVTTDLQGNSDALSVVQGQVNNPANGLSATFSLAQQAKTSADGTALAITGLQSQVSDIDDNVAQAELILQATVNDVGELTGRAFLGVTTVTGGRAVINGIVVDGATKALEFRADTLRLTNTAGAVQLYWDSGRGKFVFNGDLVGANFQTAISGYRAEMGTGPYPFWYGTGTKNIANALFTVDNAGNVTLRNASVQGKIVTSEGTGIRVDVGNDGTYLMWAGSGTKNDVNGIFWIKANGQGFVKGDFFSGQIIESQLGTVSNGSSIPATATAPSHSSAGKPVEVSASVSVYFRKTGNTASQISQLTLTVKRGTATLTTVPFVATGFFEAEDGQTLYTGFMQTVVVDSSTSAGNRSYSATVAITGGVTPSSNVIVNLTVKTFENKLAS